MIPRRVPILFVIPSLSRAGAENQVLDLLETLDDRLWCKHVVTFAPNQDQYDRLQALNVEVHHCPRRGRFDFRFVTAMSAIIDREGIEIIHATLSIAVLASWAARALARSNPALVAAIHTTLSRDRKSALVDRTIGRAVLRRCDWVIFVSNTQAEYWWGRMPFLREKSSVIHNGINVGKYSPAGNAEATEPTEIVDGTVTCVAAFRPEKGHRILIDAWSRVLQSTPAARLRLVGAGPGLQAIRELVEARGLQESVEFTGSVADVRLHLHTTCIMVLPSFAVETLSLAALESMAMEIPVVSTNIGGMPEAVLDGETGILVPPCDSMSLAHALITLLSDRRERDSMGRRARQRVLHLFDRRVMATKTHDVLAKVVRQHQEGPLRGDMDDAKYQRW